MCPSSTRPLSFKEAYCLLVKPGDGPISRHVNRRISIRISLFLIRREAPISPTTMSFLSFLIALMGSTLFILGWPFLGGLLAQLASILDGCDGEIARLTGQASRKGGLVDAVLDRLADIGLLASLGILAYWAGPIGLPCLPFELKLPWPLLSLLLTLMALSGSLMVSYCAAMVRSLSLQPRRVVGSRDVRLFTIMLAGIACQFYAQLASAFLALIAIISWAEVANSLAQAWEAR